MAIENEEKLQKIDAKIAQLKAQRQSIVNRKKEKERKERTRRLIQNGALAEAYFICQGAPPEEFETFLKELKKLPGVSEFIIKNRGFSDSMYQDL